MKGYPTLSRELGTAEGDFDAMFTSKDHAIRERVRRIGQTYGADPTIQRFVLEMIVARAVVWQAWKQSLSPDARVIVDSVRMPHHGPLVVSSWYAGGTTRRGQFENALSSFEYHVNRLLTEIAEVHGQDPPIRNLIGRLTDDLYSVRIAWDATSV